MTYRMKDDDLNQQIAELIDAAAGDSSTSNRDLVTEIIVTALKLLRDDPDRGDMKMMNTALKELRYSTLVFEPYKGIRKVAVYGSARTKPCCRSV